MSTGTWSLEERDICVRYFTGMTWAEVAAEHDMKCGACKPGMLRLEQIDATERLNWVRFFDTEITWSERFGLAMPIRTVTLTLKCDHCAMQFEMPIHAKEEQPKDV